MDITETLYMPTRQEWRAWLADNYQEKTEIWLVSYKKFTGRISVPYNDAVEEALCFGWIDGIRKGIDAECFAQRYTPRRPGSGYSQLNKERVARLISLGQVVPDVLVRLEDVRAEDYEIPDDILAALASNEVALAFFQSTSPSYQRIRAAFVDTARKRPEEFEKRLNHLVKMSARGKQFGYGIESYY